MGHVNLVIACAQVATGITLVRQEGFLALYSGLVPALTRGLLYGGALPVEEADITKSIHA